MKAMDAVTFFGGGDVINKTFAAGHPMRELLCQKPSSTTAESYNLIRKRGGSNGKQWLQVAKNNLDIQDKSSQSVDVLSAYNSVFGEMRAYADLLRITGWRVESEGTGAKGPDFHVTSNYGTKFVVEVFSYPPRPDNVEEIAPKRLSIVKDDNGRHGFICTSFSCDTPFGKPDFSKPGDSITANVISKICARKASEYQLSDSDISLLYVDFQSLVFSWPMLEKLKPILHDNGTYSSGEIWMACYGRKGYPIFEGASIGDCEEPRCVAMGHEGRFNQPNGSKVNAIIFGAEYNKDNRHAKRLAFIENVNRPLPNDLRCEMLKSRLFAASSRYGPPNVLRHKLDVDRKQILDVTKQIVSKGKVAVFQQALTR